MLHLIFEHLWEKLIKYHDKCYQTEEVSSNNQSIKSILLINLCSSFISVLIVSQNFVWDPGGRYFFLCVCVRVLRLYRYPVITRSRKTSHEAATPHFSSLIEELSPRPKQELMKTNLSV